MALYALFLSHYQNWRGPMTKPEIDSFLQSMQHETDLEKFRAFLAAGNAAFCEKLGCFDEIAIYGAENLLDASANSVFVDMSGDKPLTVRLH